MRNSLFGRIARYLIVVVLTAARAGVQQKPMVLEPGEKALVMKGRKFQV
jgi:hypothetical protein